MHFISRSHVVVGIYRNIALQRNLCNSQWNSVLVTRRTISVEKTMANTAETCPSRKEAVIARYDNIVKSPEDNRSYRGLLLSNDMKVLLVSDPTTERSAAAMAVDVGHLSDPDHIPGLAHFLEHMLFLGTEKYPNENDYSTYLAENGGNSNASTYADITKFYFDIVPDKLEGALDRFAQFFIAPLYTESATDREINAVHSEHEKNVPMDSWRVRQVNKSLSNPQHPYSKFGTGNKKTLDEDCKLKGINIRDELLKFQDKWYSANIMSLAVFGKESLDELEEMVTSKFAQVVNKDVTAPTWDESPYTDNETGVRVNVVPVKDTRSLTITFPCPDLEGLYKSSPDKYITHLLGHEGKGSLLSELKNKGYCNNLMAGYTLAARGFGFFDVVVDLTQDGFENVNEVIQHTFQYIQMVKRGGPVRRIFDEYRHILEMQFRFKDKEGPLSLVSSVVHSIRILPFEDVLSAGYFVTDWRPDLIEDILKYLEPQKMRAVVVGKKLEAKCDRTEFWYGTKFSVENFSGETLKEWSECEVNSQLYLPEENLFIPTQFDLTELEEDVSDFPTIIYDTTQMRVWHKQDAEFRKPKALMNFDFSSPLVYSDPLNCNLTHLFVMLFRDHLTEYLYNAELAGLRLNVGNTLNEISISVSGFNEKQKLFLDHVLNALYNFEVDPKRFDIFKEKYTRTLKNFEAEQPYQHAVYYLGVLLTEFAWTKKELLEATKAATPETLRQFIRDFLSRVHVECLIYGNVTKRDAMALASIVEERLKKEDSATLPLLARQLFPKREYKLGEGRSFHFRKHNQFHMASCTLFYIQCGVQSDENNIFTDLVVQILSEPCNNVLRTKEQLGYIVFCSARKINGVQGVRMLVQSSQPTAYVEERMELFLDSMVEHIESMTDEEFQRHKDSLAAIKLEKPRQLMSWFSKYWTEIGLQQYHFTRGHAEVAVLKGVTKDALLAYYKNFILRSSGTRQKLAIHIVSAQAEPESVATTVKLPESVELVTDLSAFKSSKELYPVVQPYIDIRRKGARSKL
ncbi:insulin-degrading enzyme [Phlebotomus argentipes]|uniref:insulin-degrading enzyme n=1 Tax=Phlebotomus argentipes TaxID=94469 RepID=UPI0028932BF0|nr:insulin-degrading enzyme [Phlebotomus argentipes]